MESSLVVEGVKFMFLGMGTVFLFLIILILAMYLQAYIIKRFFPEPYKSPDAASSAKKQNVNHKIAAISAAIMHHKKVNS